MRGQDTCPKTYGMVRYACGDYVRTPAYTDTGFALEIFLTDRTKAVKLFQSYMNVKNNDWCMEYKERVMISDKEVIECLYK